jgi:hypothetical protein
MGSVDSAERRSFKDMGTPRRKARFDTNLGRGIRPPGSDPVRSLVPVGRFGATLTHFDFLVAERFVGFVCAGQLE